MARFRLSADITVSAFTIVEAVSLEAAIEHARDRNVVLAPDLGDDGSKVWVVEDADGLPENIHPA